MKLPISASVLLPLALIAASPADSGGRSEPDARSAVAPVPDAIIHVSAFVRLAPDEAFARFTNVDLVRTWLAPAAEIEPRVGGKYELFWQPDDPENDSTIGCRITALAPSQLLAFQWRGPRQFKSFANAADPLTHVVVAFAPEGSGTRIHLVHSGWRSSAEWEAARVWQERAWTVAFEELARACDQPNLPRLPPVSVESASSKR